MFTETIEEIRFNVLACLEDFRNADVVVSLEYIDDTLRYIMGIGNNDGFFQKTLATVIADLETEGVICSSDLLTENGYSKVFWLNDLDF